jgi:hypothetical protein
MPDTYVTVPTPNVKEGSSLTATAYFRNSSKAGEAPTTAKYRIDCLTTNKEITDWTSLTVGESISISITATENAIQDQSNKTEKKQLTVASDPDTSTQTRDSVEWSVINLQGIT